MTYNYHYDLATSQRKVILKLFFKWKGSLWKAIYQDLFIWCFLYALVSVIYRYAWDRSQQDTFERFMQFCNRRLDYIPINFMLGFFVTTVINRWMTQFANLGMIDNIALFTSMYLSGNDERGRILRRSIVRFCVMSQTMVFRDIHIGVRKRFPSLETMVAAGIMTSADLKKYNEVESRYAKYWLGFNWSFNLLNEARREGRIESSYTQNAIAEEIRTFRSGLSLIWTYDWVPLPLMYPQLVFLAVHCYYLVCLVSRQFVINSDAKMTTEIDLGVPFMTIIEFIFYMGWLKVAMDLLNPFGEDEDDFDCNFLIDRNLTVAMGIVDDTHDDGPILEKDMFWNDTVSPLYSTAAAQRNVNFYFGSATNADSQIPDNVRQITMVPHPFNEKLDQKNGKRTNRPPVESVVELKRDQRFSTGNNRKQTVEGRFSNKIGAIFQKRHSKSLTVAPEGFNAKARTSTDIETLPTFLTNQKPCYSNPECIVEVEEEENDSPKTSTDSKQDPPRKRVNISNKRESVISMGRSRSFNHFGEHVDYHDYYDFDKK
ncbi:Protein CBG23750 [Caenorhabditis briggsae]|uniref:Bestrophin homolog n=1 Tax=Caenorhabditis briggsae TaxID=6238 RepID=A8WJ75_CAEBR|nr:Protein CBG23750 [Caenorhabditis briggsae]CAP20517.2 Protein CBG23750 [Caenorhabditis briggsae]